MLVLLRSGATAVVGRHVTVFAHPPRGTVGSVRGGCVPADLEIPVTGGGPIVTGIALHLGNGQLTLYHSDADFEFHAWHRVHVGVRSFWLLFNGETIQFPLSGNDLAGGEFLKVTASGESNLPRLGAGQDFILALVDGAG